MRLWKYLTIDFNGNRIYWLHRIWQNLVIFLQGAVGCVPPTSQLYVVDATRCQYLGVEFSCLKSIPLWCTDPIYYTSPPWYTWPLHSHIPASPLIYPPLPLVYSPPPPPPRVYPPSEHTSTPGHALHIQSPTWTDTPMWKYYLLVTTVTGGRNRWHMRNVLLQEILPVQLPHTFMAWKS